jgi:hypothetical protein
MNFFLRGDIRKGYVVSNGLKNIWYALFAVVVASVFAYLTFSHITPMPIQKDAAQNTRAAYYLIHLGIMNIERLETGVPPVPQMRREPLPILVNAAFLLLHPAFDASYTLADVTDGRLTETFKQVNVFWRFLAAIALFLLCLELFTDRRLAAAMAVVCLIVSDFFFFSRPGIVDRMYTELPEVAFMLFAAWCAVRFVRSETKLRALCLGIALGVLALTKASFLFIGIGFILLLLAVEAIDRFRTHQNERTWRIVLSTYAVIAVALLAVVAPWMVRNYVLLGKPQIVSGTDASVVGIRMLITEQPLLGVLYYSSPGRMKSRVIGPLTGYTKDDLLPGGRLAPLVALSSKEKWETLSLRAKAKKYTGLRETWLKQAALEAALQDPLRYVASIGVFAYKGMWFMKRAGELVNLVAVLCFFGVFFGALFTRNRILLAAFGLPAGLFFFVATFSHALTRYTSPITPFVVLSMLWLLDAVVRERYRQLASRSFIDGWKRLLDRPGEAKSSRQPGQVGSTSRAETAPRV